MEEQGLEREATNAANLSGEAAEAPQVPPEVVAAGLGDSALQGVEKGDATVWPMDPYWRVSKHMKIDRRAHGGGRHPYFS